jgi:hypothetical protein
MRPDPRNPAKLRRLAAAAIALLPMSPGPGGAAEIDYPQVIHTRYAAKDQHAGGFLVVWVEREKIFYGLDPKLYPAARYVDVTHVTPAPGTTTLTFIEVLTVSSDVPEFFHLSGNVRFRISGMELVSSNIPAMPQLPNVRPRPP